MEQAKGGVEITILKQDRVGRVRTPREKQMEILEAFDRSVMSAVAFAEHAGIKYPTFASWIQRRRRERGAAGDGAVSWVEAVVGSESESGSLVVELGGACRMVVGDAAGARLAAEVLKHLGRC